MDEIRQRVETWLWPSTVPESRWARAGLIAARYGYALLRELATGALSLRAMSLVFTTMLAVVPLLAFSFGLLKGLGVHRQLEPLLRSFLAPLGEEAGEITDSIIGFVDNVSGSGLAIVSMGLLLFNVLSMAYKVESSLNFVWRVERPRSFARRFSDYLSVMLVGPLIMSIAMALLAAVSSTTVLTQLRSFDPLGQWITMLGELVPYFMVIGGFSFMYVFVPNTRVRLKPALAGGALAGTIWAFGGGLFTTFVATATRTEIIYSGFAIVIVAMLWVYLSWLILLLGGQFAFYVQHPEQLRGTQPVPSLANAAREQLALAVMLIVAREFSEPARSWRDESLAGAMGVPVRQVAPITAALIDADLLAVTTDQHLVPARDPRRIRVDDILAAVRGELVVAQQSDSWSEVVAELCGAIDEAIDGAAGERTLTELVDREAELRDPERRSMARAS